MIGHQVLLRRTLRTLIRELKGVTVVLSYATRRRGVFELIVSSVNPGSDGVDPVLTRVLRVRLQDVTLTGRHDFETEPSSPSRIV